MFYHVFNRGVDKRTTFEKDADFLQFISQIQYFRFKKGDPTTEIVAVHCYTLMNNHFHLLLEELEDGGVSKFMQRLEIGYTMYFNKNRGRTGPLFSGKFKRKVVFSERYLAHLAVYIHSNPLDMISPLWRSASLPIKELLADLMNYKWSSLYDWKTREENFTRRSARLFGSLEDHLELVKGYLIGSQMEPFKIGSWLC